MSRNVIVENPKFTPVEERRVELVERKGLGHPDTLIDGIMEEISRNLCLEYRKVFGRIMHHNVDKGQICGGRTHVEYGGGKFVKPIYILLSGRATSDYEGKTVPAEEIALRTARDYLKKNTRFLDIDGDVEVESRISQGSKDLIDVFMRAPKIPLANDTSFGVGFAPFTETEVITIKIEKMLNSRDYKQKHPEVGEDIKVMSVRNNEEIRITIAIAFVSKFVKSLDDYIKKKEEVLRDVQKLAGTLTRRKVEIGINTADDYKTDSTYITLTGMSMEQGDDGSVGRGNRVCGIITPSRPMSLEAAAGKNPVNHVGKIYSVLAFQIAEEAVKQYPQIQECNVSLLSQIGKPLDEPKSAGITVLMKKGESYDALKGKLDYLMNEQLERVTEITELIIQGKASIYY
ncbi:S-adenosylmethionine synthase [Candidatus Gugararchaeum adminiculabundum]|nr:S-adenosylmethionine synthase [Candidatus Gugararchaeum adminiculabundum]